MSSCWVNKVLYKIKRDFAYRDLFRNDFEKAIAGFDLDDTEVSALRNQDYRKLFELGAKSMLLLPFAGVTSPGALFTVRSADEKRKMSATSA